MTRASRRSRLLATSHLSFGRHSGKPLSKVPRDYLEWSLGANIPPGDRWLIERYLDRDKDSNCGSNRRRGAGRE